MVSFSGMDGHKRFPARLNFRLGSVLVLLVLNGCAKHQLGQAAGASDAAMATEVGILVVKPQEIVERMSLSGRVSAVEVADVRPQVSGIVKKRLFVEGTEVAAGQVLYEIDPSPYRAGYDQARGALAKAQATLMNAKAKASRYAELVKFNAISRQEYDDASAAVREGQADVLASRASLNLSQINLDYTRITSPIAGRIGVSSVTVGALVTADQATALATVQAIDRMYLDVTLPSADWLRLRKEFAEGRLKREGVNGAQVRLTLEDGSVFPHPGTLAFTDITVDHTSGSITLRTLVPNPDHELLPGMFVRAELDKGVNEHAILVPQLAVVRTPDGQAMVWLAGAKNRARHAIVKANEAYGDQWIVSDGLKAGDRVIVSGASQLQEGVPVKIVETHTSGAAAASAVSVQG